MGSLRRLWAVGFGWALVGAAWAEPVVVAVDEGEPVVQVRVPEGDRPVDVRLVPVDPDTGKSTRSLEEALGCPVETGGSLLVREVAGGEMATLMLPPALAMGTYRVQTKPSDANDDWVLTGPSMHVAMEPVHRTVHCPQGATLRLDLQPLLRASLADARGATVALRVADRALQGVRANHEGWVVVAADLSNTTGPVHGLVRWRDGIHEAEVTYTVAWADGGLSLLQPVGGEGDGLSAAPYVRWMAATSGGGTANATLHFEHTGRLYVVRRGSQQLVPIEVGQGRGEAIDAVQPIGIRGHVQPTDIGSPLVDHAGRVWALVTSPSTAVWSVAVLQSIEERFQQQVGALTMNAPEVP